MGYPSTQQHSLIGRNQLINTGINTSINTATQYQHGNMISTRSSHMSPKGLDAVLRTMGLPCQLPQLLPIQAPVLTPSPRAGVLHGLKSAVRAKAIHSPLNQWPVSCAVNHPAAHAWMPPVLVPPVSTPHWARGSQCNSHVWLLMHSMQLLALKCQLSGTGHVILVRPNSSHMSPKGLDAVLRTMGVPCQLPQLLPIQAPVLTSSPRAGVLQGLKSAIRAKAIHSPLNQWPVSCAVNHPAAHAWMPPVLVPPVSTPHWARGSQCNSHVWLLMHSMQLNEDQLELSAPPLKGSPSPFWNLENALSTQVYIGIQVCLGCLQEKRSFKLAGIKEDAFSVLEFLEINKLLLEDLPNLRSFSLGEIVEWPSLDNVGVNNCPNLKRFGLGKIKMSKIKPVITENMEKLDIDARIAYLFEPWDDKFSMITEYAIDEDYKLNMAIDNIRPSHFTNLVRFQAKNYGANLTKFLSILMKRSNKLEVIKIENDTLNYLFDIAGLRSYYGDGIYLTEMKELELIGLRYLEEICNANPYGILDLKNLQKVHIKSCPWLTFIFYCQNADRLYQLMELKLEACNMLQKVIEHDAKEKLGIRFFALRKVEFKSLSKLEMFYYHHLEFPNLQTLMIQDCPKLIKFTTGFATANVVDTIDDKSFFKLNELRLDNCIRLVFVIHSKTLQEFRNLKKLIVTHCEALKTVFHIDGEIPNSS
ncbi:hypothetical protein Fmac_011130 [Flemingia macrophylla]|uniref:Disease resistance protein At4g27190-like leucine-rich repeats domain-containing protein n=1 Tax=Flemingia macrophylla TaxID=520843 RepID=A0ABD1MLK7_9FABA